jgi:hypothetical protein
MQNTHASSGRDISLLIHERVKRYYWVDDFNCAATTLLIASEVFDFKLRPQVLDAAVGLHGAGEYGAQCGLVEGGLMFLGLWGRAQGIADRKIITACRTFAGRFEEKFSSLECRILRPQGFDPQNPPHICQGLTERAVLFTLEFIDNFQAETKS